MTGLRPLRVWVIGGVSLIVALILAANAHLVYVAVSSQPGCAEATVASDASGARRVLQPAKDAC